MKKSLFVFLLLGIFSFLCVFFGCKGNTVIDETNSEKEQADENGNNQTTIDESDSNNPTFSNRSVALDFIFNNQTLGTTTITIKRSEWNELCDNYRYFYKNENSVHAESYVYEKDGMSWTMKDVGFRLRGNTSRFCPQGYDNGREQNQPNVSWSESYYNYAENKNNTDYRQTHFKVGFEEFLEDDESQKMAGAMKGVALKRLDHSCGREIFCYDLFHKNGIWTAPRASHTRLILKILEDESDNSTTTVDYGVYEMFEEVNKQSLKARAKDENPASNAWKNSKGNLWKCSSSLTDSSGEGMGVENIVINFDENGNRINKTWEYYPMDLKTNKDDLSSAKSEFCSFISELNALPNVRDKNDTANITTIKNFYEKWFDVDFFLKTYAVNILCGMDDDYWGNANNFYLYFDTGAKGTQKVYFIPFDYDNTLGCSIHEGGFKNNPLEWGQKAERPLMDKLLSVPEYKQKFVDYLLEVSTNDYWNYETGSTQFLYWESMVSPYLNSPDLDYHIGVNSFNDYTWCPSGYSLTREINNLFDATTTSFRKWINGENLSIYEINDDYKGIKIGIKNIPEDAAIRKIYINGKLSADLGLEWNNGDSYISEDIFKTEFGYPYTTAGKDYKIYVQYLNKSYGVIETSPTITITAINGLGDFELTNKPTYTIKSNILTFDPEPEIKIGSNNPRTDDNWDEYYILELQTTDWNYQSWNYLGASCNNFDFTKAVKAASKTSDFMFTLYYMVSNSDYGNYCLGLYDYEDTKSFKLSY